AERQVRQHPLNRPAADRKPARVGPYQGRRNSPGGNVLRGEGQPAGLYVHPEHPARGGHLAGEDEEGTGAAEGVQHGLPGLDLGEPDQDGTDERVGRGGGTPQLPVPLGQVQGAELGTVRFQVHVPRARVVTPPVPVHEPVAQLPPLLPELLAHPEPHRSVSGPQGGQVGQPRFWSSLHTTPLYGPHCELLYAAMPVWIGSADAGRLCRIVWLPDITYTASRQAGT